MKQIIDKKMCTGCSACVNVCPKKCIQVREDKYGFLCAEIDEAKCIDCALCKKTCPVVNMAEPIGKAPEALAVQNINKEDRERASSGGIYELIAKEIITMGGVVVACTLDNLEAKHVIVDKIEDINKTKGSKYVQSSLGYIFSEVKDRLKNQKILFVGTPCQVAGLKKVVGDAEDLLTLDLVCHGIPSQKMFDVFIQSKKENIGEYYFKDKTKSWKNYDIKIVNDTKVYLENNRENDYMRAYLGELISRDSCYSCKFRGFPRQGDITLGDFWGINYIDQAMDDDKGTSLLFVNSDKGKQIFERIKKEIIYKKYDSKLAIENNPAIVSDAIMNKERNIFLDNVNANNYSTLVSKYVKKTSMLKRIIKKISRK